MRVVYHPDAETEVIQAAQYYESKLTGLGGDFLTETDSAVETILSDPSRFPVIEDDIRRYLVKRFPYGIYYRIAGDTVRVLVVKHHKRHPDYGKHRR